MQEIQRRSFLAFAVTAFPLNAIGQLPTNDRKGVTPDPVPAGADRFGRTRPIPTGSSTFKVATQDTGAALFVMEHRNVKKGGPVLHLHHNEDELFYVIEGEYVVQVGAKRHSLKAGDCILGPREIPHAWAFVGDSPGRLLIAYAPAGKMEAFFTEQRDRRGGTYAADASLLRAYGMELLGPPIAIE